MTTFSIELDVFSARPRSLLLSAAALAALMTAAPSYAQDIETVPEPRAEADDETDVVVVTGSRIKRTGVDRSIAVTTVTGEEIDNRGFTNVIDALQQIPVLGNGTNIEGADLANNDFTANADLLDLGTNRTLTLINGRRFVSSNQATVFVPGNSNGAQVDLSLINPSLIERTEVIVGGSGSATYGADAVAGVVNLILKDDFEGLEFRGQGGITQEGDGGNYRFSILGGKNFLDGRANITASVEYFDTNLVLNDDPDRLQAQSFTDNNDLNSPFPIGPSSLIVPGATNRFLSPNGILTSAPFLSGTPLNPLFPNTPQQSFADAGILLTPFEFAQTAAGQAIDPLLFVGTFANPGSFLTVPNGDAATNAFLPNLAVPLQFAPGGDLVPFNLGDILPPNAANQNIAIGGDGLPLGTITPIRGGQERFSANVLTRYDLTDNITWKGEFYFADIANRSLDGVLANVPNGSTTAGTRPIPVFVDENPFLSAQAVGVIIDLVAQGLDVAEIDGSRALFLSRSFEDVLGGVDEGNDTTFFRVTQSVEGEFDAIGRNFNWDVGFVYGRVEADNFADQLLDVEFALATDIVADANGNAVCRQQTLAAPEPISVRNPQLGFINTGLPTPVTPTQAQIDACTPLNLFGAGAPSQAAIDYVSTSTESNNVSQQLIAAAQFGGEAFSLPAGSVLFSSQFEYRREENTFDPGVVFGLGLGRNTLGQGSDGFLRFFEGGTEVSIPVFGSDFSLPAFQALEINGAFRFVSRFGRGGPLDFEARDTSLVFSAGGTWTPIEGLSFRGNRSRATRSPSVVELFGAGVTGFSGQGRGNLNDCDADVIDLGPPGGIRRANCEAALALLGLPASTLDGFQAPGGAAPAAGASNPNLANESSDTWTVGVVIQPDFLPGFQITSDYYALDLEDEIQLAGLGGECFDQPTFPNSIVNGVNACDAFVFNVESPVGSGNFIVPTVNPLTGNPVLPVANPGSPAQDQVPFTSTFQFFDTINIAATELRALATTISYEFSLESLLGPRAATWGDLTLAGNAYYLRRLDQSFSGTFADLNPEAGETGDPRFDTRLDVIHRRGGLTHSLQWFRTSPTVANVNVTDLSTQALDFALPEFNLFNYNLSYEFNDRFTGRFVVNNLTNARLDPEAGLANAPGAGQGDALGRRFIFAITARL